MTASFGRRSAVVVERREVGEYVVVRVRDPSGVRPQPGQFYMLAAVDGWGAGEGERPFLPRACSVLDADGDDGELSFLLEDIGPGTRRLCGLAAGEAMWLTGPLGVGFAAGAGRPVIVGGGIGVAAVLMLWRERGGRALLGFRDARHAAAGRLFGEPGLATDDGSVGHHGLVTELLEAELDGESGAATVYACGPPAMLEAVRSICAGRGVAGQLALESPMACGFGACYGCVVATRDGYRRVCVDGPVFEAAALEAVA
jgi:dihydroorotate dehydrogenase electron transfer subunit